MFRVLVSEKQHFMPSEPGKDGETKEEPTEKPQIEELLIKARDVTVYIQKSKGPLGCFYIVSGATTAKFRSKAYLENGKETRAIQTNCTIPEGDCLSYTHKANTVAVTAMISLLTMYLNKIQGLKTKGCSTSN